MCNDDFMIFLDTGVLFVLLNFSEKFHENAVEVYCDCFKSKNPNKKVFYEGNSA